MCPTCSSFRETSQKQKKKEKEKKKRSKNGSKKEIIGCKAHVSLLGPKHPSLPKRLTFFGVKLLLYNSIRYDYLWILLLQINLLFPNGGLDCFFQFF
jgi:hypothetical protein